MVTNPYPYQNVTDPQYCSLPYCIRFAPVFYYFNIFRRLRSSLSPSARMPPVVDGPLHCQDLPSFPDAAGVVTMTAGQVTPDISSLGDTDNQPTGVDYPLTVNEDGSTVPVPVSADHPPLAVINNQLIVKDRHFAASTISQQITVCDNKLAVIDDRRPIAVNNQLNQLTVSGGTLQHAGKEVQLDSSANPLINHVPSANGELASKETSFQDLKSEPPRVLGYMTTGMADLNAPVPSSVSLAGPLARPPFYTESRIGEYTLCAETGVFLSNLDHRGTIPDIVSANSNCQSASQQAIWTGDVTNSSAARAGQNFMADTAKEILSHMSTRPVILPTVLQPVQNPDVSATNPQTFGGYAAARGTPVVLERHRRGQTEEISSSTQDQPLVAVPAQPHVPTLEDADVPEEGYGNTEASAVPLTTIVMELVEGSSSNTYSLVPVSSKESQDLLLFNNKVIHEQELDGFSFSLRTLADEQEEDEGMGEGANVLPPVSVMSSSTQSQNSEMSSVDSSLVPSSSRISYTETTTSGTSPGSRQNKPWIPAQCTICDRVFGRARYVMRHLKKIHLLDTTTKKAVQEGLMLLLPPVAEGDCGGGGGGVAAGGDAPVAVVEDRQDYSLLRDNPFLSAAVPHRVATHGSHHVAASHASDLIASAVEENLRAETGGSGGSFYDANTLARNVSDDYPDLLDSLFDALDEKPPEKEEKKKTIYVVPAEGSTVRHNLAMSQPSGRHRSIGKVLPGEKVRRGKQSSWPPQQSSWPPQQSSRPPQQSSQSFDSQKNSNTDRLRSRKNTAVANAALGNPPPAGIPTLTLELDDGSASSDAEDSFMDDEYYSDKPTTLKRRVLSDDESPVGKRARYEEEEYSASSDESESQDDGCEYDSYEDSLLRRRHGIRQLLSVRLVDVQYAKWCWRSKLATRRLFMKDTHIISALDAAYGASNVVSCQLSSSKTVLTDRDPSKEQGPRLLSPVVRLPRLRVSSLYPAGFDYRALFKGKAAMADSELVVIQILEEVLESFHQCSGSASF
jgi:hypothetical protein